MQFLIRSFVLVILARSAVMAQPSGPLLLQEPTLSKTHIAFAFAGDLWIVDRQGGEARRLTSGVGIETDPHFSPDGSQIAFTGQYDGNTDVFVMPSAGGVPKRLTYHPNPDEAIGWTPDGKNVVFRSSRLSFSPVPKLFTVSVEGGYPTELPLPSAMDASYSSGGTRLAYVPTLQWQRAWKRYQGGQTTPVWLIDLNSLQVEKIPRENSNDSTPMWIGNKVYFLSDRNGPITLFSYDPATKHVAQVIKNDGLDIKSASAGPEAIVYEQFGSIHLLDLATGKASPVHIKIAADLPEVRPRLVNAGKNIMNAAISPSGVRAVFEARGDIYTVPVEKGDVRNLTNTPGIAERDPAWSPDGKWIVYFSDESGEYALHIREQTGKGDVKKINLGKPSFYYAPIWSPDSKKIAYVDKALNLWFVDVEKGAPVHVDHNPYFFYQMSPAWSPDSQWITYARKLKSHMGAVFLYSLKDSKATQVTDGLCDARSAAFDKSGKYLYFTASTDTAQTVWFGNMSGMFRPISASVYLVVLKKGQPSPLAPESDEEKAKEPEKPEDKKDAAKPSDAKPSEAKPGEAKPDEKKPVDKHPEPVQIDLERIGQRIVSLPIPARNYISLGTGKENMLFLLEGPAVTGPGQNSLHRFDLKERKLEKLADGIGSMDVSFNGEKLLIGQGPRYSITSAAGPFTPGTSLKTDSMEVLIDPKAEWRQMYRETWRVVRDFMYDPNLHGVNPVTMSRRYEPYLENIAARVDLNYLFEEMLGELTVSHVFPGGGDSPEPKNVAVGLLGADYKIENGRYRFARVFDGENWNPQLRAPLTQPGVDVAAGEYLLSVNGRDVRPPDEIYKFFEATAGKSTTIKVGPNPDASGSREVTVVPVQNEFALRNRAWIEDNRRLVDKLSGGRLAYVYIPDTGGSGYTSFNRYFFSQLEKEGAIIDERYNGGGLIADYVIDYLKRPLLSYFAQREGDDFPNPTGSIFGPKAMLINEYAGSGGDAMPWMFRAAKIGPLIGKRTWGGLVGASGFRLIDGGISGAPQSGMWNPNGTWDVENHGVAPDIEVENDPASIRAGHDLQLEKAVQVLLDELQKNPLPKHTRPAFPNYQRKN